MYIQKIFEIVGTFWTSHDFSIILTDLCNMRTCVPQAGVKGRDK